MNENPKNQEKNFIVLIKQVPDMEEVEFDREEGRIDRSSAESEPNPFDLNALEEAVKCKEKLGGKVTAISMGPPQAESALKDALSRGADRAVLLSDTAFAGADTWATSFTLYVAIEKLGGFDLILCGEKTVDGDTGQVGPEVAELFGVPCATYVSEVLERKDEGIKLVSDTWGGTYVKRLGFPGVVTVTKDLNQPRLPSFKDKMRAKKTEIETWGLEDLDGIKDEKVGLQGSPTSIKKIEIAPDVSRKGEIFKDDVSESVDKLISKLRDDGILSEVSED